jgi:ornithine cyclodeaminase
VGSIPFIGGDDVEVQLNWPDACSAIRAGHNLERAQIKDTLIERENNTLLSRSAWVPGLGIGTKTATIFGNNTSIGLPSVSSVFTLFDDKTGVPRATVDGNLITRWKTAADSLLGAQILARQDASKLLIVSAGTVASSLIAGYLQLFPRLTEICIWNRTEARGNELVSHYEDFAVNVHVVQNLESAVAAADIISSATLSSEPIIHGDWVKPGTHVDLIGAYKPDMREADDALLQKADIYVDCRDTTLDHIGELLIPIKNGIISRPDILGDFYDLCAGKVTRQSDSAITVFKNGGGAHLDLMIADYIVRVASLST